MRTKICEIFGIEQPIFQGGMAWVSDGELAAAVSEGGGLGIIAGGNAPADAVRAEILKVRERTNKPFGVNIMMMSPFVEDLAKLVVEMKVPVLTTGAGLPSKYMKEWTENGIKVVPVVPSVGVAKMAVRGGAVAVIAEGGESGGHVGDTSTLVLVPQICDAVNVPVIAAGGIADGRGIAAAFMLGAEGVQVGTRFLTAFECNIHRNYKEKVLAANDISTIATGKRLGHPVRALKSPFTKTFFSMEYDSNVSNEQLEAFGVGAVRLAVKEGDLEKGSFLAGQVAGLVNKEQAAADIIREMFEEAEGVLKGAAKWVK